MHPPSSDHQLPASRRTDLAERPAAAAQQARLRDLRGQPNHPALLGRPAVARLLQAPENQRRAGRWMDVWRQVSCIAIPYLHDIDGLDGRGIFVT
jgi:hypothetical protein